jgi:hypothetical protein
MGELTGTLNSILNADVGLQERLKRVDIIELNYTSRLKNKEDQWILEMRIEGRTEIYAYKEPNQDFAKANVMVADEAKNIRAYLKAHIKGFHAKIIGYYFHGSLKKEKRYVLF